MQMDPLNSPHPVPWSWILATHAAAAEAGQRQVHYYRSASLRSPQSSPTHLPHWTAYSRICFEVDPVLHRSRVSSILFVENLETGTLQAITASSPLAQQFWQEQGGVDTETGVMHGAIAMLIPIAWNQAGTKLLAREFEGIFCSSFVTDHAVIWDGQQHFSRTYTPQIDHDYGILLGWSDVEPDSVLFETVMMGRAGRDRYRINAHGYTEPAPADEPRLFGQMVSDILAGPQAGPR